MSDYSFSLTVDIAKEILSKIKGLPVSDAIKIATSYCDTSSKNQSFSEYQDMRIDSYLISIDSENWICATTEIIKRMADDEDILSDDWYYSACVNGEMYY